MTVQVPEIKINENVNLNSKESAIIVVDMQNDFCDPKGSLYVPESRKTIEPIMKLLEKARDKNVKIFYTQDTHQKDDKEFEIWPVHVVEGTWGWEIIPELKPKEGDIIIRKLRYDGFYGTSLDHYLKIYKINNVVIVGTVANICVLHTAGSAALRWYNVIVPIDGISALNEFDYYSALRQIEFLYRGILTKVEYINFN
ncbi:MAG: isochorismatase family cysteine hydrolase [Candidatus Hydrothermia bacterium]|jgi:nicotinamidase-related amidase|nr:isochorismatase family cysteine hydrolase [Candidatus Hydrothermia bacterium]